MHYKIEIISIKDKQPDDPLRVTWTNSKLSGDCSSYSIGAARVEYARREYLALLAKLVTHISVAQAAQGNAPSDYTNKFVFTDIPKKFTDMDFFSARLLSAFNSLDAPEENHSVTEHELKVKGWHGDALLFKIVEVSKRLSCLEELDIPWKDLVIHYYTRRDGGDWQRQSNRLFTTFREIEGDW